LCSELVWVINQISADGDVHLVGITLLGPMVYDNARVDDGAIFGDVPDFVMGVKKDSVSANSGTYFSLHQPMEFLGHRRYPKWTKDRIVHELGVLCDGLVGHGVNDPVAYFLNVNTVEDSIRHPGKSLRDSILRRRVECKVDDMVEGLA
jgi:hypothetical protein